ncbi:MAG: hypothetical protein M5U32_02010 [Myxococcota bacterium]|nr:hypothetical protein [Myxococcota bacterium]
MSEEAIAHHELLLRVAEQLSKAPSATDHLMLTKWRVLSMCQYLLGGPERELEDACRTALEAFVVHGPGAACDKALEAAGAVIKRVEGTAESVLPSISKEKRAAVSGHLDTLAAGGVATIERALRALPAVRERVSATVHAVSLPGIRHRFELAAAILEDRSRPERERARAAAAVLYVDEVRDVVPDTLGVIGMVDDDYALRVVLEEVGGEQSGQCLHWSEKISSLWDDLPFLQGVNLQRGDSPISVTWLDRVNSYVSYSHVMGSEKATLVLLQPSIACSPLHAIISLLGLLVLDAVTSSQSKPHALRAGQTYELDNFVVRFEGLAGSPAPGWLRLRMRDGVVYQPPGLADRMVPVDPRRLSSLREFSSRPRTASTDPMQRFFNWDAAIGPASISSRLVVVASRQRALDLLEGVQSNGVRLLDHGLVRFVGAVPDDVETHGALVLVVPSLRTARLLLDRRVRVQAILVDGYERLHRGRHELPFLINRQGAPPIISWSATGYYPAAPPTWLPPHTRLEVSSDDLADILELDDASGDPGHASLWEAATGIAVRARVTPAPAAEVAIVDAIDEYLQAIRTSQALPEYWQYHLTTLARTLRTLVASTPAEWSEIKRFASAWSSSIDEKWSALRPSAIAALADLRNAEKHVLKLIGDVPDAVNSRAAALAAFLSDPAHADDQWHLVCDRPEQAKVAASVLRALGLRGAEPALLHDLPVCSACVVAGWVGSSFARRLWAHTPRAIVALTDEADRRRWERAAESQRQPGGQSLLGAVGGLRPVPSGPTSSSPVVKENRHADDDADAGWGTEERVPCVFVWVTGETEAKVLESDGRVVVEEGDVVRERVAARVRPDDRVILGLGTSRWSPADEFTGAVVDAVEASHPGLVETAKEWRRALRQLVERQRLSTSQLRVRLAAVGVGREDQTLEGWLDIDRASPIAPRGLRNELGALWPLVEQHAEHSLDDVAAACARLRALRAASGRALLQLWKGRSVELGVDEASLKDLVDRLRQEVQVYEVEAVTLGEVPRAMLGWWIPATLAGRFESESATAVPTTEADGEDDAGTA